MLFTSGKEMHEYIVDKERDLYNKEFGIYLFKYNDVGSICKYNIDEDEEQKLRKLSSENNDYWGAFLGPGGYIFDDPDYDDYDPNYEASSYDLCDEYYDLEWEDVTP